MAAKFKKSGWVGIEYEPSYDEAKETQHWTITKVVPESPAEAGGLLPGDVVYAMYGIEFKKANEKKIDAARKDWAPGQEVTYSLLRDGKDMEVKITLSTWPADIVAQWIGKHMMEHAQVSEDVADADS
jgi:S1-C subfamily serine protease